MPKFTVCFKFNFQRLSFFIGYKNLLPFLQPFFNLVRLRIKQQKQYAMRKVFLIFFSLAIAFSSCEKDDLTQPVEVEFEFVMESLQMDNSLKASNTFQIDEGTVNVSEIQFDGKRSQGEDYYFNSNFENSYQAQLHNQAGNANLSFDIPQGIYDRIDIDLYLGDTTHFALQLRGRFRKGPIDDIQVDFQYNFQEQVRVRARNRQGNEQVVLTDGAITKATVTFDVPHLFQLVSMNMLQNAEISNNVLEINQEKNTEIFNLLATRLDNSMHVVFE